MHTTYEKSPTGCRPAQLLGPWAMEARSYDDLYDRAMAILASDQLELVGKQSAEQAKAAEDQPPYKIENGIARFLINGPTTRYPTSMQAALGGTATVPLQRALRLAAGDGFVMGGFVEINSPGGTVDGATELAVELARFRGIKPLRMHVAHMGTSCAQFTGIEGDVLTVDPMGIVGSVGVLSRMRDTSKLMERAGVKMHYIASGDRKAAGAPGTEITPEQIAEEQKLVDAVSRNFLDAVKRRRPQISGENMTDIARAGCYDARRAMGIGLVDGIMTTDEALEQFTQRLPYGEGRSLPG